MNIINKTLTYLAVMPFFPILVSAQSVKDLCDHHVEELGGKAAIQRVETLKITQVGTSNGINMPTTTVIMPGKAYYQKVRTAMGTYTTCAYGDKGWSSSSTQSSMTIDLPSKMVRSLIIDSKFYGPLCDYYINGISSDVESIVKEGETTVDREKCFKLGVTYKSGYKATVYLSSLDYMTKVSHHALIQLQDKIANSIFLIISRFNSCVKFVNPHLSVYQPFHTVAFAR